MKSVASIAVVGSRGSILYIRRTDNKKWCMPGGHLYDGEDPKEGALRELWEEVGLRPKKSDLEYIGCGTVAGRYKVYSYKFEDKKLSSSDITFENDPDEEADDHCWFGGDSDSDYASGLPESEYCHVPNERNVTLMLLGLVPKSDNVKLEAELSKKTPPKLPQLGVPDNRRPTDIITTPRQLEIKQRSYANSGKESPAFHLRSMDNAPLGQNSQINPDLSWARNYPGYSTGATQQHEDFHGMIARAANNVSNEYEEAAPHHWLDEKAEYRQNLTGNIHNAIQHVLPANHRMAMNHAFHSYYGFKANDKIPRTEVDNEKLAFMFTFLNDPHVRLKYATKHPNQPDPHPAFKAAYKAYQEIAPHVNTAWANWNDHVHEPPEGGLGKPVKAFLAELDARTKEREARYGSVVGGHSLAKMAIKDLPEGEVTINDAGHEVHDYSHMLPKEWHNKLALHVRHKPNDDEFDDGQASLNAHLYNLEDPEGMSEIGTVKSGIFTGRDGKHELEPHSELHEDFHGHGLGRTMYEALYNHALNNLGISRIAGGNHSEDAHQVHSSLARRHGLEYVGKRRMGDLDLPYGRYSYTLKSEGGKLTGREAVENAAISYIVDHLND